MNFIRTNILLAASLSLLVSTYSGPAPASDLGSVEQRSLAEPPSPKSEWTFVFTAYGWIPWLSGNMAVRGRTFDVNANAGQILSHLDWSTLPAWMSYAEARNGPVSLFNDVVYANITGAKNFARASDRQIIDSSLGGAVSVDYEEVIVEFGGAYEVWTGRNPVLTGSAALDLLAGGRYWHQSTDVSANVSASVNIGDLSVSGNRVTARSGSVDWVDPFIGARLRNQIAPGQELMVRADVGGFGVGSDPTWQVLATYNWRMCTANGHVIDGYLGYRALSVDYSQGSGNTTYQYNVLQQGPVIGTTLHF
ncbi:hypothetical protein SAMN04488557_0163 [Hyphomicrobium facile]|uniref:Uncharacterized protein n=1 Tax=Hyphomicrobium facile TaxID=51670 RepID=A0A1I7MTT5_9HYPH|nr:hypothetical protein SAMN04488557_0163 [Hyphomicrobium facile]